jgi:hypothetical protein
VLAGLASLLRGSGKTADAPGQSGAVGPSEPFVQPEPSGACGRPEPSAGPADDAEAASHSG